MLTEPIMSYEKACEYRKKFSFYDQMLYMCHSLMKAGNTDGLRLGLDSAIKVFSHAIEVAETNRKAKLN